MIEFSLRTAHPSNTRTDVVAVAVHEGQKLSWAAQNIDAASQGALSAALKAASFSGRAGVVLPLFNLSGVTAARVFVYGAGNATALSAKDARASGRALAAAAVEQELLELTIYPLADSAQDALDALRQMVLGVSDATYRFEETKGTSAKSKPSLKRVRFGLPESVEAAAAAATLKTAVATIHGVEFTKYLGNLPPNHCTPARLGEEAKKLGKSHGLKVTVMDRKAIEKLGMGSFLSVTNGSDEPPRFIVFEYGGGKKGDSPTVFVGKGVTFDTGGISLKPAADMDHMKWDMSGAGTVFGVMKAVAELKPKQNIVGLVAACENMPSGKATKPGDVFKSMSGQTIEVLNTDAEGRLILCDALTYAERFKPRAVIDIATLTGACVVALGSHNAGLFSSNDALADAILASGKKVNDRFWRMPLEEDYQEALNSNFADMANVAGRDGGAITAACFLWRFAKKYDWAHLDIAGVAYKGSGKEKGATGRPVAALVDYVMSL
ncbi:MAG: leucyl aminopeptidase [Burkholderiales bacterium]|nr:leucyl aminopeptidase [Burkholderiales bacterium]